MKSDPCDAYTKFGHKSFKKLVCTKPGSRQPTVHAGELAIIRQLCYAISVYKVRTS